MSFIQISYSTSGTCLSANPTWSFLDGDNLLTVPVFFFFFSPPSVPPVTAIVVGVEVAVEVAFSVRRRGVTVQG